MGSAPSACRLAKVRTPLATDPSVAIARSLWAVGLEGSRAVAVMGRMEQTSISKGRELMGMHRHTARRTRVAVAIAIAALVVVGSAAALQALPAGAQVNDDPAAGIDKAINVNGDEPTNADVVGGALTAGKAR
jgi:hypothetical protein